MMGWLNQVYLLEVVQKQVLRNTAHTGPTVYTDPSIKSRSCELQMAQVVVIGTIPATHDPKAPTLLFPKACSDTQFRQHTCKSMQ